MRSGLASAGGAEWRGRVGAQALGFDPGLATAADAVAARLTEVDGRLDPRPIFSVESGRC